MKVVVIGNLGIPRNKWRRILQFSPHLFHKPPWSAGIASICLVSASWRRHTWDLDGGNWKIFDFHPGSLEKWSNLTNAHIFQMGWFNHQLVFFPRFFMWCQTKWRGFDCLIFSWGGEGRMNGWGVDEDVKMRVKSFWKGKKTKGWRWC